MCYLYIKRGQKPKVKVDNELELALPLNEPNKADTDESSTTNVLTHKQAAAILLSTPHIR
jgi:hypothetical protein